MIKTYLFYIFGLLPSVIWLVFYLRKDAHPESNKMIIKIFLFGAFIAFVAILLERGFRFLILLPKSQNILTQLLAIFIGGALIEEYLKYLVVKISVFRNSELDEPFDLLLYMIISALGFAALENILVLSNYHPILNIGKAMEVMTIRFISATFLHALCSGLIGSFLILSLRQLKKRKLLVFIGIGLATILHGLYNLSIMKIEGLLKFILPVIILIVLSSFISFNIKKVKKIKGVCITK